MSEKKSALRILYVEDDPDIQTIARIALEDIGGLDVVACESGDEALDRIRDFQPDVMLLDVMMPVMDGPTLLAHLRQTPNGAHAKAIFMTARIQHTEIQQYLALGAIEVIAKPFDPMTLAQRIVSIAAGSTT